MIKFHVAVYSNEKIKEVDTLNQAQLFYHTRKGARFATIEIDFDKLPDPKPVFGRGIVIN